MNSADIPLGATVHASGVTFRVWAPLARYVELQLETPPGRPVLRPMTRDKAGYWNATVEHIGAGQLYRYRIDGGFPVPDPMSRFQPQGVHGPSQVIDPADFTWTDSAWQGLPLRQWNLYELHVGTFSPRGDYRGVQERLPYLRDLGINVIELMPLADFPGRWNWGYDGVALFAPARCYGTPTELRQLIDTAHALGLAVILDVVYNHLGPDGNYLWQFATDYFSRKHQTRWGPAPNFDGPRSQAVRQFFRENALRWLGEYHFDGLRLDATDTIADATEPHILADLADAVQQQFPQRRVVLIAEDGRNLSTLVRPRAIAGFGLDAVWSDDFHNTMRRFLTGDCEGYFQHYRGTTEDLATILNEGWLFIGSDDPEDFRSLRGSSPSGLLPEQFVIYLQNHDQVGNRATGDRLHHAIAAATYRAASAVLLSTPQTPMLWMGQEWAATTPFCFFTDHHPELGRKVTEGRRREFRDFQAFRDPSQRERIPDPQAEATFRSSVLRWEETTQSPHREMLNYYRALLHARCEEPWYRVDASIRFAAFALDEATLLLQWHSASQGRQRLLVRLRDAGTVTLPTEGQSWQSVRHSEEAAFAVDPMPPHWTIDGEQIQIHFARPGAIWWTSPPTNR